MNPQWISYATGIAGLMFSIVTAAISYGATRTKVEALTKRVDDLDCEMRTVSDVATKMQLTLERLVATNEGQKELFTEKFDNLGHKVNNLRQVVEGHLSPLRQ